MNARLSCMGPSGWRSWRRYARARESDGAPSSPMRCFGAYVLTARMEFEPRVFDVWTFRRAASGIEYLLLHTSAVKAERHFNGGRFWQIPSGVFGADERVTAAIDRVLGRFALRPRGLWAAEHAYTIHNRRFDAIQIVTVFAAELADGDPTLDPEEHDRFAWLPYDAALDAVRFRGLKDGLRSVREYVTEPLSPMPELCLASRAAP